MTVELLTFYQYIINYNTENTNNYRIVFENSLNLLPDTVCSSKVLYDILLIENIRNNDYKRKLFNETFCEYLRKRCDRGW
jgi:hypothetical protein